MDFALFFSVFLVLTAMELRTHSVTRYTVRGRGAKRRTSSALPTTYLWSKTTWPRLAAYARSRQFNQNFPSGPYQGKESVRCEEYRFLTFSLKCEKSRSEKGPWTDCSHSLTTITPIYFLITQNPRLKPPRSNSSEAPSRCRPQKSIISRSSRRTSVFGVPHGWKKRFAQQEFWIIW